MEKAIIKEKKKAITYKINKIIKNSTYITI